MTKSQNTKNEQQKDLCITSEQLTKQFLDDELDDSKLYYFKQKMSEEIEVGRPFALNMVRAMDDTYLDWFLIDKVLAPVPSYEEWQLMQDDNKRLKHDVGNLGYKIKNQRKEIERQIAQNAQLKELLKECRECVDENLEFSKSIGRNRIQPRNKGLLKRIDEV